MPDHAAVQVNIKASPTLATLLIILHVVAAGSVFVVALPGAVKVILAALVGASAIVSVCRHALLMGSKACVGMRLGADGGCELSLRSGRTETGDLLDDWFASPNLLVLNSLSDPRHHRRSVVLLPDSADREALRNLRVFLRFKLAAGSRRQQDRIGRLW